MRFLFYTILSLLMMIGHSSAEQKLVKVTGSTLITSSIGEDILKQRAIADALQSAFLSNSLKIDSFTLVENGSIQLDQIQAASGIEIISFEITDTSTQNGRFTVSATLIFSERSNHEPEVSCKRLRVGEIPTELQFSQDLNRQPFWLKFNKTDFTKVLPHGRGPNSLSLIEQNQTSSNESSYYILHKKNDASLQEVSPYRTEVYIDLDHKKSNSLISKKQSLLATMSAKTYRETQLIATTATEDELTLSTDILVFKTKTVDRKSLVNLKSKVQSMLTALIDNHMRNLECLDISPTVKIENNQLLVNYGKRDGLEQHDLLMFTDSGITRDFYKIIELDDYTAKVAPVSTNAPKRLKNGDRLYLISEQS